MCSSDLTVAFPHMNSFSLLWLCQPTIPPHCRMSFGVQLALDPEQKVYPSPLLKWFHLTWCSSFVRLKSQWPCLSLSDSGLRPNGSLLKTVCFGKLKLTLWLEVFLFPFGQSVPSPHLQKCLPYPEARRVVWTDTLEFDTSQYSDEVRTFMMVINTYILN